jgi:hypothetical protein
MWNCYVAIGDSVTEGIGDVVAEIPCESWCVHLSKEWREQIRSVN